MNHSRSGYGITKPRYPGAAPQLDFTMSKGDYNRLMYELSGIPYVGDVIRMYDTRRALDDYMHATGLTWADIKYPSKVMGAGDVARFGYNLSTSILRMYR